MYCRSGLLTSGSVHEGRHTTYSAKPAASILHAAVGYKTHSIRLREIRRVSTRIQKIAERVAGPIACKHPKPAEACVHASLRHPMNYPSADQWPPDAAQIPAGRANVAPLVLLDWLIAAHSSGCCALSQARHGSTSSSVRWRSAYASGTTTRAAIRSLANVASDRRELPSYPTAWSSALTAWYVQATPSNTGAKSVSVSRVWNSTR